QGQRLIAHLLAPLLAGDDLGQAAVVGVAVLALMFILAAANLGERHSAWAIVGYAGMTGLCAIFAILALGNIAGAALGAGGGTLPVSRVVAGNLLWFAGAL